MGSAIQLVLYSKPGCHLCEGLQEKLESITSMQLTLEIRDITSRADWFQQFQYEIPVLFYVPQPQSTACASLDSSSDDARADQQRLSSSENDQQTTSSKALPVLVERASPRAPVSQVEKLIRRAIAKAE